jgi:hypothetical protein
MRHIFDYHMWELNMGHKTASMTSMPPWPQVILPDLVQNSRMLRLPLLRFPHMQRCRSTPRCSAVGIVNRGVEGARLIGCEA